MADHHLTRRSLIAGLAATTGVAAAAKSVGAVRAETGRAADSALSNPLVRQRADAQIFRHEDGYYYMTGSVPEYDRLALRRARTLAGLADAPEAVAWRRPAQGKLGGYIWAPELHWFDGRWHFYFAAGDSAEPFHIRTYVLATRDRDPMAASWTLLGQLQTPWDSFTLDSTSFVHRGVRYLCWAQKEPGIDTNSNLYLAPLATPTTLARAPVRLSVPTLEWEIQGFKVNEAPALLERHGRLFLTYSASATDARYCLGLLSASADADIMQASSWSKSPVPVFTTSAVTGVYGPGHNSFTVDEEGRDVLVYHGRDYEHITGDPLFDPNRHTRVQRLYYRPDGVPDFGIPVGNGPLPDRLSPVREPGRYLIHRDGRVLIGDGPLPSSQFRQRPGTAPGSIRLEPIDAPGHALRRDASGAVSLVPVSNGTADAAFAFRRMPGLAGGRGASFAARDGGYLGVVGNELRVIQRPGPAERADATFLLT